MMLCYDAKHGLKTAMQGDPFYEKAKEFLSNEMSVFKPCFV